MSGNQRDLEELCQQAAGIVAASNKKVGIKKAMTLVGFTEEESKLMKHYQKVRRLSMKLVLVEKGKDSNTPLSAVNTTANNTEASDLTNSTNTRNRDGEGLDAAIVGATARNSQQDRSISIEEMDCEGAVTNVTNVQTPQRKKEAKYVKKRRTSKAKHESDAKVAALKMANKLAMKAATTVIANQKQLPQKERRPAKTIVDETNAQYNSNINISTVRRYVRLGLVGVSPLKTGPVGHFPKRIYDALKGAFCTYLKLEQAHSKKQSSIKVLSKLVNATVNKAGFEKTRDDLTRKLKKETAHLFEIGKANIQEARRALWTTKYNLDIWFTTWKDALIELGFGRQRTEEDTDSEIVGEVVLFQGQARRIVNLDETDGGIDDTTGQRGGRPPMTFTSPDVAGGATAVHKSGYKATVICGSNAAGEPLPPHFQLKSEAKTAERQKMSVDWFTHTKNVLAQFGHNAVKSFPCTFGMNEKAGMNTAEFDKYVKGSILPLYPDVEDVPGKRVILKVDSGPGRMNIDMLAALRLHGFYLFPGVPNTTGKTQETDQNYGDFKSDFRDNVRRLSQARYDKNLSITIVDLPLLIFGGRCPKCNIELVDAFGDAFSIESNLSAWRKCGAIPLTRQPVHDKAVRSEIPVGAAEAANDMSFVDPEIEKLRQIERLNNFYCDLLLSNGYDGEKLRLEAPTRSTRAAVTVPHTKERVEAIKKAKTHGQMFYATGGSHLNSDDFFKATELRNLDKEIAAMEAKKEERKKKIKEQKEAVLIIRKKGELTDLTIKKFTNKEIEILLKWKGVKGESRRRADIIEAYINAKKPPIVKSWTRSEEAALVELKNRLPELRDTAIGVAASQMATAVRNNLANLDEQSLATLKSAIDSHTAGSTEEDNE